ncbi:MAG: glutathione S-transferase N-terminal domain-containing protein [Candidatus Poseidoniaceae archaeon]|nr:glutathione S-transferase N-terminal domain-containing protein [Candidatus Poseidoniaceae archaeon]
MSLPILYSFRRCPYAMRARMAIVRRNFQVEHREVILRDRPEHMMQISPKGTVPVMLLPDGTVIEESLEIMEYVQSWNLTQDERNWVNRNDDEFKFHLDRYKYPNRYEDVDHIEHRTAASHFINDLNENIPKGNLSDAIFPFIRQFANHDRDWFDSQGWDNVHKWLEENLSSEEFKFCMTKYPQWVEE